MRPIRHNPSSPWFWIGGAALVGALAYMLGRKGVGSHIGKQVIIPFSVIASQDLGINVDASMANFSCTVQVVADDGTTCTGLLMTLNGVAVVTQPTVHFADSAIVSTL